MTHNPDYKAITFGTDDPRVKGTGCEKLYIEIRDHLVSYGHTDYIKGPAYRVDNRRYWGNCSKYVEYFIEIAREHREKLIEIDRIHYAVGYDDPQITKARKLSH